MNEIKIKRLEQLFFCDPINGLISWRPRTPEMFRDGKVSAISKCNRWNGLHSSKQAGCSRLDGRFFIRVDGVLIARYRIIWAMANGYWPSAGIDHIDHDCSNDRLSNLREADQLINLKNQSIRVNNCSGVVGVSWHKSRNKWRARIVANGEDIHLGLFESLGEAENCRKIAEKEYGFHANHGS